MKAQIAFLGATMTMQSAASPWEEIVQISQSPVVAEEDVSHLEARVEPLNIANGMLQRFVNDARNLSEYAGQISQVTTLNDRMRIHIAHIYNLRKRIEEIGDESSARVSAAQKAVEMARIRAQLPEEEQRRVMELAGSDDG